METRESILSLTAKDFTWSYTKGSGAGGQKRNKTSSAVHCIHELSGAHGYSEDGRSQLHNKQDAFKKMANNDKFQKWLKIETAKKLGTLADIDKVVDEQLKHVKLEIKQNNKWIQVTELPPEEECLN